MLSLTMVLLAASAAPSDLEDAVAKTAKVEGYEFTMTSERTGGGFGGGRGGAGGGRGGRGGGAGQAEPTTVSAKVGKGGVMFIRSGDVEAYKQGTAVVTKGENGEWELAQARGFGGRGGQDGGPQGGRGGRRGGGDAEGGQGGGRGGDAEGGQGGRGGRRGGGDAEGGQGGQGARGGRGGGNNNMRAAMQLRTVQAPHETLSAVIKHLENVQVEDKDGSKVYTADLTAEGVQAVSSMGRGGRGGRGGGGGGRGGFGGDAEQTGKAKIIVNKDGYVTSFNIETKTSMSSDRGDFEFGTKQECTLKGHGATKVEVSEKIQKLLDSSDEEIF